MCIKLYVILNGKIYRHYSRIRQHFRSIRHFFPHLQNLFFSLCHIRVLIWWDEKSFYFIYFLDRVRKKICDSIIFFWCKLRKIAFVTKSIVHKRNCLVTVDVKFHEIFLVNQTLNDVCRRHSVAVKILFDRQPNHWRFRDDFHSHSFSFISPHLQHSAVYPISLLRRINHGFFITRLPLISD